VGQDNIKFLLEKLNQELALADNLDEDTLELARQLEREMEQLIERSEPVAERILRELIAVLGRMGI
jgi:hypothetical protein